MLLDLSGSQHHGSPRARPRRASSERSRPDMPGRSKLRVGDTLLLGSMKEVRRHAASTETINLNTTVTDCYIYIAKPPGDFCHGKRRKSAVTLTGISTT